MKYKIAIIPSESVCTRAIEINKDTARYGRKFVLGMKENMPHVTIANFAANDDQIKNGFLQECDDVLSNERCFLVHSDQYRNTNGWIDVIFVCDEKLQKIHDRVLQILCKNKFKNTADAWIDNPPHITFSRIDVNQKYALAYLQGEDLSFTVERVGIFEDSTDGVAKKLLYQFILK